MPRAPGAATSSHDAAMRPEGLEPPRVAPQDPKSCASTSSATVAGLSCFNLRAPRSARERRIVPLVCRSAAESLPPVLRVLNVVTLERGPTLPAAQVHDLPLRHVRSPIAGRAPAQIVRNRRHLPKLGRLGISHRPGEARPRARRFPGTAVVLEGLPGRAVGQEERLFPLRVPCRDADFLELARSEEHTSELQSLA